MNNCCNNNLHKNTPRGRYSNNHKRKMNFYTFKKNTITSLNQVEYFLNNYKQMIKYIKLYKLLK